MNTPVSFRIHYTNIYEKNSFVANIVNKIVGKDNYNKFTIKYKICQTNHNLLYKTFYIHFYHFILTPHNSHFINKILNSNVVNIMYSYPLYWRCSIINNSHNITPPSSKLSLPKPLPTAVY